MLAVDPPDHTRYRKLVTPRLQRTRGSPRWAGAWPRSPTSCWTRWPRRRPRTGTVDLVADYASLLPATVIAEMLGAPVAMRGQFLQWGAGAALSLDPGLTCATTGGPSATWPRCRRWMAGHLDRLRRSPGDDLLSALVAVARRATRRG